LYSENSQKKLSVTPSLDISNDLKVVDLLETIKVHSDYPHFKTLFLIFINAFQIWDWKFEKNRHFSHMTFKSINSQI
jgi:hypothetical protein